METGINQVIRDGKGNAIVYTALIAAALANVIPTPFDAIYFRRQQILKEKLQKGQISVSRYWYQDVGEYYLWTALWYAGLIVLVASVNSTYKTNSRMLVALAGSGLVVGVLVKNIQKDKEILSLQNTANPA